MTPQEAQSIIDRLCLVFRFEPKDPREFDLWFENLLPISYERADKAVRELSRTNRFKFMPRVGEFLSFMSEISGEGAPNAIGSTPSASPRVDPYLLWRQDQIVAMSEEDYWRYLYEAEFRAECERRWQDQWAHMPDKPYQHREVRAGGGAG